MAPLSVSLQGHWLLKRFPASSLSVVRSTLTWNGTLQPSALSDTYQLELTYRLSDRPRMFVISPTLDRRGHRRLPHTFSDESLCLYYSPSSEWRKHEVLADTIVPWSSEWLLHYELWLVTGRWLGGGIHPEFGGDRLL
jgi:hypothetical protein